MMDYKFLNNIKSPSDLKSMSVKDLEILCKEIRDKLVCTVSKTGGHLSSNLGVVELTVALHKVFDTPKDKIIFDVGHQCYTHKMLTGRLNGIDKIRQKGGLSGFPKRSESEYDPFNVGHSSTSISAAYGLLKAKEILKEDGTVVAVIGDGALTGGLAYEGLNNAGRSKKNFIVVLNDNKMSISKNVGSISRYLARVRARPTYIRIKSKVEKILVHTPLIGKYIRKLLLKSKSVLRSIIYKNTLFEDMGFTYYGPFDGHDIDSLIKVFKTAKQMKGPILVHVITKKGKGYQFAENDPKVFHGISGFDIKTGMRLLSKSNFSEVFGKELCNAAKYDRRICAITAAMKLGTGLRDFSRMYKDRFFDVGIAEGHAVTFASGLAAGGMLPIFAVYSSFLQRGYDQIIHDAAMQNLKVVLCIDRAGIVGEDGETHQGVFDVPFLNSIPNVTILAPSFYGELGPMLNKALYDYDGVVAIRYPRGGELYRPEDFNISENTFDVYGKMNNNICVVTYGRIFSFACGAKDELKINGIDVTVLKLNRIKPIDNEVVKILSKFDKIFFFEESMKCGGVAEHLESLLIDYGFKGKYIIKAIDNMYIHHNTVKDTLAILGLDSRGIVDMVSEECKI